MPHEVIMPALGMSQDTGQIVAWLKRPGDAVKAGEALMEVETDKATMEVEASHDGFLTDVRADEGDSVPVGDIVALISEDGKGSGDAPPEAATSDAPSAPPEPAPTPAGKEVIMPALGMSQDSGKIVAWAKAPGDPVAADDVLAEVETDKATMEVHAGHDGWLAETRAAEDEDVPVGEVIAIISAEKPESPRHLSRSDRPAASAPAKTPSPEAQTPATADAAPAKRPASPEPAASRTTDPHDGRILASPKARRLAAERGLDLARLVEAGHPQPYHVADLDTLAALPATPSAAARPSAQTTAQVVAEVPAGAFTAFLGWAAGEGAKMSATEAFAAFSAGALRATSDMAGPVRIGVFRPGEAETITTDPDLALSSDDAESEADPDLWLRDLTDSRLTALTLGPVTTPALTVSRTGEDFRLTLDFDAASLKPDAAIALLEGLAARIEDPLRNLL